MRVFFIFSYLRQNDQQYTIRNIEMLGQSNVAISIDNRELLIRLVERQFYYDVRFRSPFKNLPVDRERLCYHSRL